MNDIFTNELFRQLPDLQSRRVNLEQTINRLKNESYAKVEKAGKAKAAAENNLARMNNIKENFRKTSMRYWNAFAEQNNADSLSQRIKDLKKRIEEINNSIKYNDNWINEARQTENKLNNISQSRKEAEKIWVDTVTDAAETAMLSGVCIYVSKSGWKLASMNEDTDWGVHCVSDLGTVKGELSSMWRMMNFMNYNVLAEKAEKTRKAYSNYLYITNQYHDWLAKNNLVGGWEHGELDQRQGMAVENTEKLKKELAVKNKQLQQCCSLYNAMKNGKEAFLRKDFYHESALTPYSEHINNLKQAVKANSDYNTMAAEYNDLCEHVADYKNLDTYLAGTMERLEEERKNAPKQLLLENSRLNEEIRQKEQELESVKSNIKEIRENYEKSLLEHTKADPISTVFYTGQNWVNSKEAMEKIKEKAETRYALDYLPTYKYINVEGRNEEYLGKTEWQTEDKNAVNLMIFPKVGDQNKRDAGLWAASNMVTTILMSMPIGKVHFIFIDLGTNGVQNKLLTRLNNKSKNLYTVINETRQLDELKKEYNEHTATVGTDNLVQFHKREHDIRYPYRVIVWVDCYDTKSQEVADRLSGIMQNGARYGYYVMAVPLDNQKQLEENAEMRALQIMEQYGFESVFCDGTDFESGRSELVRLMTEYVEKKSDTSYGTSLPQPSMSDGSMFDRQPESIPDDGIKVPIGMNLKGVEEYFVFNPMSSNQHTILMGSSGSGKTYLMHNVLLNCMLKYKAEDLEFYIMDFKMGGTEFNRYGHMPHVSHLLIDDADRQAVYEIMKKLEDKMRERGRRISESRCENLPEYNRKHPEAKLPYIMLVVDESYKLFEGNNNMQKKINKVVSYIVKEGRSQGVTFFFSTQTFKGVDFPEDVKSEAGNRYLMHVNDMNEAESLINGGGMKNQQLTQGLAYYNVAREIIHIYDYKFKPRGENKDFGEKALEVIKANNRRPEGRADYVFSGKDIFRLDDAVLYKTNEIRAALGKAVSVDRNDLTAEFHEGEPGNNMLIAGVNSEMQAERVFWNVARSLASQKFGDGSMNNITIIDNKGQRDENYGIRKGIVDEMRRTNPYVEVVERGRQADAIYRMGQIVRSGNESRTPHILMILGHEMMKRVLSQPLQPVQEMPIMEQREQTSDNSYGNTEGTGGNSITDVFKNSMRDLNAVTRRNMNSSQIPTSNKNVEEELKYILSNGSSSNVFVIVQVNDPANLLANDMINSSSIKQIFNHFVALNMSQSAANKLPMPDNLNLPSLKMDKDTLRAYYYLDAENELRLFTPYIL